MSNEGDAGRIFKAILGGLWIGFAATFFTSFFVGPAAFVFGFLAFIWGATHVYDRELKYRQKQ